MNTRVIFYLMVILSMTCACVGPRGGGDSTPIEKVRGAQVALYVADSNGALPVYRVEDRAYIMGTVGNYYEILVANQGDTPVEAVVSVDGRDVISGRRADFVSDRGYVLLPGEEVRINGFRTSMDEVAAFQFAQWEESYSTQMGDGENTGVIGVAVFAGEEVKNQVPAKIANGPTVDEAPKSDETRDKAAPEAPSLAAKESQVPSMMGVPEESLIADDSGDGPIVDGPIGTAFGENTESKAEMVSFRRTDAHHPAEIVRLYYGTRADLERAGVVFDEPTPDPVPTPDPFPGSPSEPEFASPAQ